MERHKYMLRRSGSVTSLASLAGDRKHGTKDADGAVKLDLQFEAPSERSKKKIGGTIHIVVKEGFGLHANEPYVKLYLSKDNKDIKGTKQKTKPHKKRGKPIFEERFTYYLKKDTPFDDSNRLQITVWEHKGIGANECVGGFSFSFQELVETDRIYGWFQLFPERDGRFENELISQEESLDVDAAATTTNLHKTSHFSASSASINKTPSKRASVVATGHNADNSGDDEAGDTSSAKAKSPPKKRIVPKLHFGRKKPKQPSVEADDDVAATPSKPGAETGKGPASSDTARATEGREGGDGSRGDGLVPLEQMMENRFAKHKSTAMKPKDVAAVDAMLSASDTPSSSAGERASRFSTSSTASPLPPTQSDETTPQMRINLQTDSTPSQYGTESSTDTAVQSPGEQLQEDPPKTGRRGSSLRKLPGRPSAPAMTASVTASEAPIPSTTTASETTPSTPQPQPQPQPHEQEVSAFELDVDTMEVTPVAENSEFSSNDHAKLGQEVEEVDGKTATVGADDGSQTFADSLSNADDVADGGDDDADADGFEARNLMQHVPVDIEEEGSPEKAKAEKKRAKEAEREEKRRKKLQQKEEKEQHKREKAEEKEQHKIAKEMAKAEKKKARRDSEQQAPDHQSLATEPHAESKTAAEEDGEGKPNSNNNSNSSSSTTDEKRKSSGFGRKLFRTNSMTSLISLSPDQVVSSATVKGAVCLGLRREPSPDGKSERISLSVEGSMDLVASAPYLKMYVSRNGVDIKGTKWKSPPGRSGTHALVKMTASVTLPESACTSPTSHRLQFSVWDKQRLKANECMGGFSFLVSEIPSEAAARWYRLFPFHVGRGKFEELAAAADEGDEQDGHMTGPGSSIATPLSSKAQSRESLTDIAGNEAEGDGKGPTTALSAALAGHTPRSTDSSGADRKTTTEHPSSKPATLFEMLSSEAPQNSIKDDAPGVDGDAKTSSREKPRLKRASSLTSLVSVASANIVSAETVSGEINITLTFEPSADPKNKIQGTVRASVSRALNLSSKQTYVKVYYRSNNRRIKSTKMKSKVVRNTNSPVFEQTFHMPMPASTPINTDTRVVITLWESQRVRANECLGAVSFNVEEIASTTAITGWFDLLPFKQGAEGHPPRRDASATSPRMSRRGMGPGAAVSTRIDSVSMTSDASEADGDGDGDGDGKNVKSETRSRSKFFGLGTKGDREKGADRGQKKRLGGLLSSGSSSALKKELEDVKAELEALRAEDIRHVREIAELQKKLHDVRENRDFEGSRMQEAVDSAARLQAAKEDLEDENHRLHQMVDLLQSDARSHRDEISLLRDRVEDMETENKGLRAWKTVLGDELLKASPKAFSMAAMSIADAMDD